MRLFIFGVGFSSKAFVEAARDQFDWIGGTTRSEEKAAQLKEMGVEPFLFDGEAATDAIREALRTATHVLVSIAPNDGGDPVLNAFLADLAKAQPQWIAYLSTVGVYGDHDGAWVTEETECKPVSLRSRQRVAAESQWLQFAHDTDTRLLILRLSGIYGKGRNGFVNLERGTAKRVIKPGQVFNRIHAEDIAGVLKASLSTSAAGIYNVSDDEPAPPQDVVTYAAELMGVAPPPEIPFEEANMSPMGRSFYGETKRVDNAKVKRDMNYTFAYPTYRVALDALWRDGYK
ncbi:SDR family oxidoreductase [Pseudovibrio exalbescens]|uniref:SDR family oxidoreductase n=1 Tax=Pseudovibrio exalbescens TaxID=197461 RepID=UPI0023666B57|nr:SDR family oxidoreductase [Pseudovibrio exalbescens]MDD7910037.1 SDR family oxidoreductase [Pseudovibrio exalbescens]